MPVLPVVEMTLAARIPPWAMPHPAAVPRNSGPFPLVVTPIVPAQGAQS
jgi:hypothetical protein